MARSFQFSFRADKATRDRIHKAAKKKHLKPSWLIRQWIGIMLEKEETDGQDKGPGRPLQEASGPHNEPPETA